jgi:V8-like Glu-specific endopeptidase
MMGAMIKPPLVLLARLLLVLLSLAALAAPARADDISAAGRSVVRVVVVQFEDGEVVDFAHGTGFAVAPNRIVTNAHVVMPASENPDNVSVGVVPSEGDQAYRAKLISIDPARDLALIEMEEGTVPAVPLYMGPISDGSDVVALGYPGNVDMATAQSADDYITPAAPTRSEGNYSNARRIAGVHALLHTAAIARGNSGGPLLDNCGRVIGVNSFITAGQDGDAPFGFAIANRELAAFLRAAGQPYTAMSNECVSMSERLREDQARALTEAERRRTEGDAAFRAEQEKRAKARDAADDKRENRVAIALFLGVFGTLALAAGGALLFRGHRRPAYIAGAIGLLLMAGAALAFFTRPARGDVAAEEKAPPVAEARSLVGANICHFVPERSRVTVSSTEDVSLDWGKTGCVNGRTQYARDGEAWSRILVPNDEATVSVAEFRPASGAYVVTRYLLGAVDMRKVRGIRGDAPPKACTGDTAAMARFADRQAQIRAALPRQPHERLVYRCEPAPKS